MFIYTYYIHIYISYIYYHVHLNCRYHMPKFTYIINLWIYIYTPYICLYLLTYEF